MTSPAAKAREISDRDFVTLSGYRLREIIAAALEAERKAGREEGYDEANKDFNWLQSTVAKIYCHFTDNKMSKWNYDPEVVITEIEDTQNQFWEEEIRKARQAALEEAAKIAEEQLPISTQVTGQFIAERIRAKAEGLK